MLFEPGKEAKLGVERVLKGAVGVVLGVLEAGLFEECGEVKEREASVIEAGLPVLENSSEDE